MIVLSGANIKSGGPLQIFKDILFHLNSEYPNEKVTAIVNNVNLFPALNNVQYVELPLYKKIIVLKFFYEYVWYYFLSKRLRPTLWLSLNDCTPSVRAGTRAVYCHNATPFYPRTKHDLLDPNRAFLQSFYYWVFYRINIHKNDYVIVQQRWFKDYFEKIFRLKREKIIINPFSIDIKNFFNDVAVQRNQDDKEFYNFIYPTKAVSYKNLKIVFEAARALEKKGISNFKIFITINGTENQYSKQLYNEFKSLRCIVWLGNISRENLEKYYAVTDCLLFPSKLETWGLPISEFKKYERPMIIADLPYAHETAGSYPYLKFFNPNNLTELEAYMSQLIKKETVKFDENLEPTLEQPFAYNWKELFIHLDIDK